MMKSTRSTLSGVVASLIPFMLPDIAVAFTENVAAGIQISDEVIEYIDDDSDEQGNNQSSKATQQVYGTAINTVLNNRGEQIINPGGLVEGTTINSGGTLINKGGEDNATLVNDGGTFTLSGQAGSYAISRDAIIGSGASVIFKDYAETDNWIINGGRGDEIDLKGASSLMKNTVINSGRLNIYAGETVNTTLYSGHFANVSGTDIDTVIEGGAYTLGGTKQAWSENLTINSGAWGYLNSGTITNATITGALVVTPADINGKPEVLSSLKGEIAINDGGLLRIENGSDTGGAIYNVSGSGQIELLPNPNEPGVSEFEFALGNVALTGGTILYGTPGYSVLTLSSLSGSGTFRMNTDLAALKGDFLEVTGSATGNFAIYVTDSGQDPENSDSLQIVQIGAGDAAFTLANSGNVVDVGTWQYHLVADGQGGWALTPKNIADEDQETEEEPEEATDDSNEEEIEVVPVPELTDDTQQGESSENSEDEQNNETETSGEVTPASGPSGNYVITPSASAVLSIATVDPLIFRQELETLNHRLSSTGALAHDNSVWSTIRNSRLNISNETGADYRLGINALAIGADRAWRNDNSVALQGLFFSYSHSDMRFRGKGIGKADIDSWSGGVYGSWLHDADYWLDGALKVSRFSHEVKARMSGGGAANGDFHTTGIGATLKAGKNFHIEAATLTPWLAVTGFTGKSSNLSLNNGMKARIGPQRSLTSAAGLKVEYKVDIAQAELYPWASVSVEKETVKSNRVRINSDRFKNDLSGNHGVYQAGIRAELSPTFAVHVGAGYMQGRHIESPWSATAGVNWRF
ncbi:autotransporter outer membrane beta-barrel domain-containing protein [Kalamiella sp. sgz302252]|uniref:autotransporter outer membrane beta-barrel domain-containing protein n=1 Tax=Pantoea sp. sgz302252 TaxID=3341827 RepID=UPI0036D405B0